MEKYIYQYKSWPNFTWSENEIQNHPLEIKSNSGEVFKIV